MRPSFHVTITDDAGAELDVKVWAEAADRSVGLLYPSFEFEPDEPRRVLSRTEEAWALKLAAEWRP